MEIGTEISRKIRTAIKGKLLELGAYVDEELPDYIMVMVANKKTQDQMTDDLSLFLGNNTSRFTTWLQGVLDKLRNVTPGSNSLKASEAIIFNSSMPPLKSQSREDSGREAPPQRQETYHSGAPSSASDRVSAEAALAARLTSAVKPLQESSLSEAVIDIKLDLDDSFNDDFAPESSLYSRRKPADFSRTQRPSAQIYRPPGSVQSSYRGEEHSSVQRPPPSSAQRPPPSSGNAPQPPSAYSRAIGTTRPYDAREAIRSGDSYRSAMSSERAAREMEGSRKRRMPVASSVVKVKRFTDDYLDEDEEEEEEEEEDYTSRVAGLTSSVSVPSRPERRPTLPPSKQANKNLILKAISEAQESITKTTSYSTVPPKQTVPVAPRARQIPEEELIRMKSRLSMLRYQEEPEEAPAVPAVVVDSRQAEERKLDILSRLQPEPMDVDQAWGQESGEGQNLRPVDSRSFILTSKYSQNPPGQTPPTTDDPLQYSRHIKPRDNPAPEKPPSPKFIVTLEGVPSPQGYRSEEDMEEPMMYSEEGEIYPYKSQQSDPSPTSQDGLSPGETAAPTKTKIPERCKYWPACKNGVNCAYHHPTNVCKAFPKCRFADKCFFIHPNCKYDAKCMKTDCQFTHASRRGTTPAPPIKPAPAAALAKSTKVLCRFFPACKNTECTFFHPKHCRFSSHCTRPDCEFYHPKIAVPPRHALTWTRAQASE